MPSLGHTETLPVSAVSAVMPNTVPTSAKTRNTHPGRKFFSHPEDFPLEVRTSVAWPARQQGLAPEPEPQTGLRFFYGPPLRKGSMLRLTIPIRHQDHNFTVRVIDVEPLPVGHDVRVLLHSERDADRLELVEKICALECARVRARVRQSA